MAFTEQEKEIILYGKQSGKTQQEVEQALARFRLGVPTTPPPVSQPSRFQETVGDVKEIGGALKSTFESGISRINDIQSAQARGEQGGFRSKFQSLGAGASTVARGIGDVVMGAGKAALSQEQEEAVGGVAEKAIGAVAETAPVQGLLSRYEKLKEENPAMARDIDAVLGLTELATTFGGAGLGSLGVKTGVKTLSFGTKYAAQKTADAAFDSAINLRKNVQNLIARKNVNPQLESSAQRLFLEGTKRTEDPLVTYDNFLSQSQKALTDIKVDPAVSVVGERMGDAFESVVKNRQAVGATIGEELKTVGKLKVAVQEPKTKLLAELKDSGLSYNPRTRQLTSFQGSKFAGDEVQMLNDFVKGINALGDNPTVSQIDNFIAKTRSDLAFTKGKAGVTGTTNAERIIKTSLANLRGTLDPAKNGQTALKTYWEANKAYSDLSDFVDEGAGFLGKYTQSGDFAKDASLAKSAVQSVLNNGKKDWLVRLEALTGYPALDESVLALQAMKDAGDFRGTSLLQALSEGAVPTSKAGFTQKAIDYALSKGGEAIAGAPEDQTRAFLRSLKNKSSDKPFGLAPKGGLSIQAMHKEDRDFMFDYVHTVKSGKATTPAVERQLEEVAKGYGFQLPEGKRARADFLEMLVQGQFNSEMKR